MSVLNGVVLVINFLIINIDFFIYHLQNPVTWIFVGSVLAAEAAIAVLVWTFRPAWLARVS